jgi:hypothetical protein
MSQSRTHSLYRTCDLHSMKTTIHSVFHQRLTNTRRLYVRTPYAVVCFVAIYRRAKTQLFAATAFGDYAADRLQPQDVTNAPLDRN